MITSSYLGLLELSSGISSTPHYILYRRIDFLELGCGISSTVEAVVVSPLPDILELYIGIC